MKHLLFFLLGCIACCNIVTGQTYQYYPSNQFSSGLINDICQDRYGFIWIATDYGLNKFDGYHFTTYLHDENNSASLTSNTATHMYCDNKGQLWVGTRSGLDRYDYATDSFHHIELDPHKPRVSSFCQLHDGRLLVGTAGYGLFEIINNDKEARHIEEGFTTPEENHYFRYMLEDSKGRLWMSGSNNNVTAKDGQTINTMTSDQGVVVGFAERKDGQILIFCSHGILSSNGSKLMPADIDISAWTGSEMLLERVTTDTDGNIYIGTRNNGLFWLPANTREVRRMECSVQGLDLNTAKVRVIKSDRLGNIWLGCQSKGLLMISMRKPQFRNWSFGLQKIDVGTTVTAVAQGDNGTTWCTVQGNGVYGFDRQGRVTAHPSAPDATEFIFRDRKNQYWIGTDQGLYDYDPMTGKSHLRVTFDCDMFNDMTDDGSDNIYISTFSRGFCVYNTKTGHLKNYCLQERDTVKGWLCNDWVMAMMPDKQGCIWLATSNGVSCFNPKTETFRPYGWVQLLDGVMCYSLCETSKGDILIGTDRGIFIYEQGKTEATPFRDGDALRNKVVGYIVEANNGDIWCGTTMGIWQLDKTQGKFIGHFNGNGLSAKEYISCVGMHTDDDMIYFANNDGLTVFNPSEVTGSHTKLPDVQLTAFLLSGKPVSASTLSNGHVVTDKPVIESDRFEVSYLDNSIGIEMSLLDNNTPQNIIFEYRVNGGEWMQTLEGQNNFQLSHLQPGTYKIEMRALTAGIYSSTKSITVIVTPPWWRTPLAMTIYVLAVLALLGYLIYAYNRKKAKQLDEEKMKFLINATHDIRSPLTLIMSPLHKIVAKLGSVKKDEQIPGADNLTTMQLHDSLTTIDHNAQRILDLVNQILDVRKIDKKQMQLHCRLTNIVNFAQGVCKMFEYNAQERGIHFLFTHTDNLPKVWIDSRQFDKVLTNLLSNAFKYTADGGTIEVHIDTPTTEGEEPKTVNIQVIDNGVGLAGDNVKHIFDRFYQGANSRRLKIDGTGIGLNLCKMIVDLHHGTIDAQNRTNGEKGSIFTVSIPTGTSHLLPEEIEQPPVPEAEAVAQPSQHRTLKQRVLIVDDDLEIGQYISAELGKYFKFSIAANGKEGLKELLTNEYDVVISDVMMPEMDGFTMLRLIKTNANISHIPVIMLTSKTDIGNRLKGLERGADAYLAKPFDIEELRMNIENQINNIRRLRGKFSGAQQQTDKVETIEVKGNDEILMERIMKVANAHLSDSDFSVDMLTREVGISRTQLHRKMKEMTGISTSEFIRNIRLEQAARLLKEQKINITQVAYTVGFSNLAHFSTVFRKHFGVAPSEYAES